MTAPRAFPRPVRWIFPDARVVKHVRARVTVDDAIAGVPVSFHVRNTGVDDLKSVAATTNRIYVFYCSNSFDISNYKNLFPDGSFENKFISLPCSGKANLLYLVKAFETGVDGIVLLTCPKNECRFLEGNLRAPKRAEAVNALMEEIGLGKDRVLVLSMNGNGPGEFSGKISEFYGSFGGAQPVHGGARHEI